MTIKTIPKFGNGDGNWSKMKDLLYRNTPLKLPWATISSSPGPASRLNGLLIAHFYSHSTPLMGHYFFP